MAYGLRIWDESGNLTLDISDGSLFILDYSSGTVNASTNKDVTVNGCNSNCLVVSMNDNIDNDAYLTFSPLTDKVNVVNKKTSLVSYKFLTVDRGI